MSNNQLRVGEPRLCRLIDGNPNTPEAVVMLQDTGDAIETTFPLSGMARSDGPYDRWWSQVICYGDDPDREKYSYAPPSTMLLYDSDGWVALVGCRATRGINSLAAGTGVVVADFAVLGAKNIKYDRINGMRTESPAFLRWIRRTTIEAVKTADETGLVQSMRIDLHETDSIAFSRKLNMSMRQRWSSTSVPGGLDVREFLTFQSLAEQPCSWEEHLQLHVGVLDLVSIAAWRNCAFRSVHVSRADDPLKMGGATYDRWNEVATHALPGEDLTDCDGRFLFFYDDMPKGAVDKWLRLRDDYDRVLGYVLRILRSGHTWSIQSAIMSAIALEQLGYLIEIKKNGGGNLNDRGQLSFNNALAVVLNDMTVIPFEAEGVDDWKKRCNRAYMGAKHGDRDEPDHLTVLNTLRENLLVLRYWVAQQLGVPGDALNQNLTRDPLANKWRSS